MLAFKDHNQAFLSGFLVLVLVGSVRGQDKFTYSHGAIIRGDTTQRRMAIVFTGDLFAEGGETILETLKATETKASFFLTGNFYRNPAFRPLVRRLKKAGHYLGAHSDRHLLYCDWTNRDSLLITKEEFQKDLLRNYAEMAKFGISKKDAQFFLPPYEWYNDSISAWTRELGIALINFTPGTLSHADYTTPDMKNYQTSERIFRSIVAAESGGRNHLNGFILLMHIGSGPKRTDKLYHKLNALIRFLKSHGYELVQVNVLFGE
jgi:peptidoglycan/xylan/chitin deacetylase (PgdA/CDA1 family)